MADEHPDDLKVAGCWAHARRRYAEIVKAAGKKGMEQSRLTITTLREASGPFV